MTQHTSHVLYFHIDAIQRKRNSCILFTKHIHPRRYKRLFQQNSQKKKSESSLGSLLPLCLFPQFFCNRSSTIRQMQRKITNTTKLPSIELPTLLPKISPPAKNSLPDLFFRTPFVSSQGFLSKSPCLLLYAPKPPFHNCSTDPDHNIGAAIQPPFNSSHPANLPAKTPHTNQAVLPMQM